MVESEIRTEHLSSTLAIVRRVITYLETSTWVQLTTQNPRSDTSWFQLVEIHWQSKCRVLRPLPPWTANSQIRVVAKQSSKRSVMISTDWRSQSWLIMPSRNPYPATAVILWENSGLCRISWPVSTQARQLSTATQVTLYGRLFSTAQPRNTTATSNRDNSASRSSYLMEGAVGGMFTGVICNNSSLNISINFQSSMTPTSDSLQWNKAVRKVTF